jgi:biotin transport system substrate-specific component
LNPNSDPNNGKPKKPQSLSPTPLRDWLSRQPRKRRWGLVALFSLLMACGGKAGAVFSESPVPATHQMLFVLLAGAVLGSRLGTLSALLYLLSASVTGVLWPIGTGPTPLVGPLAGYLWSLPIVAYLSGLVVEKAQAEQPVFFAVGVTAGIAAFDACGSTRLLFSQELGAQEAFARGVGLFVGQHILHGALAVLIASSASSTLQAKEKK